MINRNSVLCGINALALVAAQAASAAPPIPTPDTPPVTVTAGATYDTNVAGSSEALAAARGLKRVDVLYNPALLFNVSEPVGGGLSVFLLGQAGYDAYQRNSILDRENINLQAGANAQLDVCDTTAWGSWARNQSNVADLSIGTTKNTIQVLSGELDATCNKSGPIIPSASISQTYSTNSAVIYATQDYQSLAATASLAYKSAPIGTLSVFGQYTQTEYPHRLFLVGSGLEADGYNLYSGGLRFDRDIGSTIHIEASIGDTNLSPYNGLGASFSGITYDANLGYHPDARLTINLGLSRKTLPSYYLNAAYSVDENYNGEADYRVTSRLTAKLGATDTHSNFAGAALVPGTNITDQTFLSFYGGLAFAATPTFSVSLNAGQDQRHANVIGYSYAGAHVGLAVSKAF